MITKNDCLTILVKLEDSGAVEAKPYIKKLMISREPSIEVLRFIASQRGFGSGRRDESAGSAPCRRRCNYRLLCKGRHYRWF